MTIEKKHRNLFAIPHEKYKLKDKEKHKKLTILHFIKIETMLVVVNTNNEKLLTMKIPKSSLYAGNFVTTQF